jgi:predicted XRE-type DNA-binding protein
MPTAIKEGVNMGFPTEKELKSVRAKLEKVEPSYTLRKNASNVDIIKYKVCEKFVIYLMTNKMTQAQLAKKLKVSPARVNEIVKYRIDLFTLDKLIEFAGRIDLNFELKVA